MKIGKVLQTARQKSGLTQKELADAAGVHRVYVSMLERDRRSPTLDVLFRIANAVGVRPSTLVARIEEINP